MKYLYIDCSNSGLSGDMFLAALLGLIPDHDLVLEQLNDLKSYLSGVKHLEITLRKIKRHGILVNYLDIALKETKNHRSSRNLMEALEKFSDDKHLSQRAKKFAINVLNRLIEAEKVVHGSIKESIHLHELSSVDTLIDILGAAKALDLLEMFKENVSIYASAVPLGGGSIQAAHGKLPIPAPATVNILKNSEIQTRMGPVEAELLTPTGAALLVELCPQTQSGEIVLKEVVHSTGNQEFDQFPNILRIYSGAKQSSEYDTLSKYREVVVKLETNIDDISGEILGDFMSEMQQEEILDIQLVSSVTKKNRPSYILKILCNPSNHFRLIKRILTDLGTLGVRVSQMERICVDRINKLYTVRINEQNFKVNYKISFIDTPEGRKVINIKPEYEDLKVISSELQMPLKEIYFHANALILDVKENFLTSKKIKK